MYDLSIIGAGWAGFNAALRARSLGLKTALIEESSIGGTCLNRGCIPTKTLVQSAKILEESRKAGIFGIGISSLPQVDFLTVQARKDNIIRQLAKGMESRLSGIDYLSGSARIADNQLIKISGREISTKNILLAVGSSPVELPGLPFDGKKILSSDQLLKLETIPGSLLVVGGGVIGCEFAWIFASLGSKVSVVELSDQLLPGVDRDIARKLETVFKKKGVGVSTSTDAGSIDLNNFDKVLVCVGRKANYREFAEIGIETGRSGFVVDDHLRTSVDNIYAAGDCTGKLMLAHYASYQGVIAAENIRSPQDQRKADNTIVPACIFTSPEIACVGLTEAQARQSNAQVRVSKFDFLGSAMARIQDETEGFIKVVSEGGSNKLLGAHIIGAKATELISVFALALNYGMDANQLKRTIFAHPTFAESIVESLGA